MWPLSRIPLRHTHTLPLLLNNTQAAKYSSLFPAGIVCTLLGPGHLYTQCTGYSEKRQLCLALQGCAIAAAIGLLVLGNEASASDAVLAAKVGLMFLLSFGVGVSYYIPVSSNIIWLAGDKASA